MFTNTTGRSATKCSSGDFMHWLSTDAVGMSTGRKAAFIDDSVIIPLEDFDPHYSTPPQYTPYASPPLACSPIPVQPPAPCYNPEWIYRRPRTARDATTAVAEDQTFWTTIIRPRTKAERSVPMLGPTEKRVTPSHTRSPSLESTASSSSSSSSMAGISKTPAKSILTRSSSISTKNSYAKSVKFVDMPTVHYECDDDYLCDEADSNEVHENCLPSSRKRSSGISRLLQPFGWGPAPPPRPRPSISSPFALGALPPATPGDRSDAGSIRSVGSSASTRSERLMRSISGPFPLRGVRSLESVRPRKPITTSSSRFRTLWERVSPPP